MNQKLRYLLLGLVLFFGLCLGTGKTQANEMNYGVEALIPENQVDKTKTYFDLRVTAGQTQELALQLTNYSQEELTLVVTPQDAATNSNGVIDYSGTGELLPEAVRFSALTSPKKTITLKAAETQTVTFTVNLPADSFDGHLLGAFQVMAIEDSAKATESSEDGITLKNRFAYVVGVALSESATSVVPEFSLDTIGVAAFNQYYSLKVPLVLASRDYLKDLSYTASVYPKGSRETILTFSCENFSMAPESLYTIYEKIDPEVLTPGTYELEMTVKGQNLEKELQQEFTITKKAQQAILPETLQAVQKTNTGWYWLVAILLLFILLLSLLIVFLLKKKREVPMIEK